MRPEIREPGGKSLNTNEVRESGVPETFGTRQTDLSGRDGTIGSI